jgi:hypothetical protein
MGFKLATIALTVLLGTETFVMVMSRRTANRFRPVENYDGLVAFDTASGRLCKTIVTKSAAEIAQQAKEQQAKADASREQAEREREKAARTHSAIDDIAAAIDEQIGASSRDASVEEFIATLPACKTIR